jgi:deoxyribodipyrimidine photolyase
MMIQAGDRLLILTQTPSCDRPLLWALLNEAIACLFALAIALHLLEKTFSMSYQNISAQLSDTDLQEIKAALATIETKLPFLVHLSVEERRKLFKMGNKSLAFVNNSLTAAQSNPDILPASFDMDEFVRDYQLATTLTEVHIRLQQLAEKVDDTLMAVSSEAMTSSLTVYDYVKTAAKKTPGLKAIAEQLSDRFKASRAKAPKATPDPESAD